MEFPEVNVSWLETGKMVHVRAGGKSVAFSVGQFITFEGHPLGVRVEEFFGRDAEGPKGFTYLPWRGDRWGTPKFSLRGNPRFVICPPVGMPHYGLHINWESVELLNDGVCPNAVLRDEMK
jgi:hypothetical protein